MEVVKDFNSPNKIYSDIRRLASKGDTLRSVTSALLESYSPNRVAEAISEMEQSNKIVIEEWSNSDKKHKKHVFLSSSMEKASVYAMPGTSKEEYQLIRPSGGTGMTMPDILKLVSTVMGVGLEAMKSKCRNREFVEARHIAMYFCKKFTNSSLKFIGKEFGNRDHSTVIHALQSVSNLIDTDKSKRELINRIQNIIKNKNDECRNESIAKN